VPEAYKVFESILEVHGYTTVPAGKVIKVLPATDARGKSIITTVGTKILPSADTMITQVVPINLTIKDLDTAAEAQITDVFPTVLPLYDPVMGQWITKSPWAFSIGLKAHQTETIRYYALVPDAAGTYVIATHVGFTTQGTVIPPYATNIEITVGKDAAAMTADIIDALNALSVSKKDRPMAQDAIKWLQQVQHGHYGKKGEFDQDIHAILQALDALMQIQGVDISEIRLMLDALLRVEEGRYYFQAPK
jgi:hypothetical protein